jgi:hypothetical protein
VLSTTAPPTILALAGGSFIFLGVIVVLFGDTFSSRGTASSRPKRAR